MGSGIGEGLCSVRGFGVSFFVFLLCLRVYRGSQCRVVVHGVFCWALSMGCVGTFTCTGYLLDTRRMTIVLPRSYFVFLCFFVFCVDTLNLLCVVLFTDICAEEAPPGRPLRTPLRVSGQVQGRVVRQGRHHRLMCC